MGKFGFVDFRNDLDLALLGVWDWSVRGWRGECVPVHGGVGLVFAFYFGHWGVGCRWLETVIVSWVRFN